MSEIKDMNIYQRIHAVSSEVGKVSQSLEVATKTDKNGKVLNSYKAVSINDVVDSLLPVLEKYRVAIVPGYKKILKEDNLTTTSQYGERTQFFVRMMCEYIAVNIDDPAQTVSAVGYGDGVDSGDKACGKADTYARKTALISLFNLSRGDDPDRDASLEYKPKSKPKQASVESVGKAISMYTPDEMKKMLKKLGVASVEQLSQKQVDEMIAFREKLSVTDQGDTF